MLQTRTMVIMVFLVSLFIGCSAISSIRNDTNTLRDSNKIKSVSVLQFTCSDSDVANTVRNLIIDSLLTQYTVVIGSGADAVIKGTIILSSDKAAVASSGSLTDHITDIKAQVIKNNSVLDSITHLSTNLSVPHHTERMGRAAGEKIKKALDRY